MYKCEENQQSLVCLNLKFLGCIKTFCLLLFQISYLVFLGLYSYILIVQLTPAFHFLEGILIGWVFTIFVEEMRQVGVSFLQNL